MAVKKEPSYKKNLVYLKDFVYIVGIVIALYGWISTKSESNAILETTVKYNTETIDKLEVFMINQLELNGKVIQYMAAETH